MITHAHIDRRLHRLIEACVLKIDQDQGLLERARRNTARIPNVQIREEWEGP